MTRPIHRLAVVAACLLLAPRLLQGQERGAAALGEAVAGLDVTPRVLLIGAHPDDEDTQLIAWLRRGRQVETAYLSLTRGDGGQNLIGNELGPVLGMIRTEELLAARRIDGGRQYFTRAYDFGFSKSAEETYTHWPKDSILRDVVAVVRAFRPQIIVAVFSGTPRDGHGHHQVSGQLAREAFDAAADTVRFPRAATLGLGAWAPSKFYRAARFNPAEATLSFNVGELSPWRGMTYAEIASLSRSQHLSQGFGVLQRHGTSLDYLKLEASRLPEGAKDVASPLDGIATDWSRFAGATIGTPARAALDSLPGAISAVRAVENVAEPATMVVPLARVARLLGAASVGVICEDGVDCLGDAARADGATGDLYNSLQTARRRVTSALLASAGVLVEATAPREVVAIGDTVPVTVSVYNQGRMPVRLLGISASISGGRGSASPASALVIAPDSAGRIQVPVSSLTFGGPWWLQFGREGDVFRMPGGATALVMGEERIASSGATATLAIDGVTVTADATPIVYRMADPARGELRRPAVGSRAIGLTFENSIQYARAGAPMNRELVLHVASAAASPRGVTVRLALPAGLSTDSATRRVALEPFGQTTVQWRISGRPAVGEQIISASAESDGKTYTNGWRTVEYAHIRPIRYDVPAAIKLESVDAVLPRKTNIAYVPGVGDNAGPHLGEMGLAVTMLAPDAVARTDLSRFAAVVIGPRAFAAVPTLAAQAGKLQAFARSGGTVVVQYGQAEMQAPGLLPYPVKLSPLAERVTDEAAPVTVIDRASPLLALPNRIGEADFANWVQERSVYMPTSVDPHWRRLLEMHDPGAPANENSVLVATVGRGAYVYTTLALFRQIPAGVPGGMRLLLNMINADARAGAPSGLRP